MATPSDVTKFVNVLSPRDFAPTMFALNFFNYSTVALQQVFVDLIIESIHVAPVILRNCKDEQQRALLETLMAMGRGLDGD